MQAALTRFGAENAALQAELRELRTCLARSGETGRSAALAEVEGLRAQLRAAQAAQSAAEERLAAEARAKSETAAEFKALREENARLTALGRLPRSAREVDLSVLEAKLMALERDRRLKDVEVRACLRALGGDAPARLLELERHAAELETQLRGRDAQLRRAREELAALLALCKRLRPRAVTADDKCS